VIVMKTIHCCPLIMKPVNMYFFFLSLLIWEERAFHFCLNLFINVSGMKVFVEVSSKALVWTGLKDQLLLGLALLRMTQYVLDYVRLWHCAIRWCSVFTYWHSFLFTKYHSTECKVSVTFNYFVNHAVVELGSAICSEYKINFIFHYCVHTL
jgi:hypothetical protein